jgi:hypothetical protein
MASGRGGAVNEGTDEGGPWRGSLRGGAGGSVIAGGPRRSGAAAAGGDAAALVEAG